MFTPRLLICLLAGTLVAGARAAERPLLIDPAHSRVEIAVKATVDSFVARLTQYRPLIQLSDSGLVTARFAFHFRDIDTGKEAHNKAMHKWQQSDTYPDGEFVLTSLMPADGNAHIAFGRLTLHGVARKIKFPLSLAHDGSRYALDGDATLDTREFGLPVYRLLALLKVDPIVHVRFHLQGTFESGGNLTHLAR